MHVPEASNPRITTQTPQRKHSVAKHARAHRTHTPGWISFSRPLFSRPRSDGRFSRFPGKILRVIAYARRRFSVAAQNTRTITATGFRIARHSRTMLRTLPLLRACVYITHSSSRSKCAPCESEAAALPSRHPSRKRAKIKKKERTQEHSGDVRACVVRLHSFCVCVLAGILLLRFFSFHELSPDPLRFLGFLGWNTHPHSGVHCWVKVWVAGVATFSALFDIRRLCGGRGGNE